YYLIVASGRPDFATADNELATARVYATHLTLVVKNPEAPTIVGFVTDALTGAPAIRVDVSAWQKGETTPAMLLQKTTTDLDGCFSISNRGKEQELIIAATHGDHRAAICLANRSSAKQEGSMASDSKETKESASIFTDRSIYRPGQTIHFKGILCESNKRQAIYRTLAGRAATVVFRDPNGREAGKLDAVTNDYGSLSGTFTAPGSGVLGTCSLAVEGLGDTKISIEEYKRPKFHVTLMPPDAPVALGDRVVMRGKAETFAGAAVDGAHVKWHVTCLADSRNLGSGTLATAADGSFAIPFTARVSRSIESEIGADDYFDVGAEVTDTSGETCTVSYNVPIGGTSMNAYLETNEWQDESKPVLIKILTCLPDAMEDRPIAAAGTLAVYQVKDPQAGRRFLHPVFRTGPVENVPYEPPGDLVKEVPAKTGDSGIAEVPVALPVGTYQAVFSTKDAGGREVRALNDFTVINPNAVRFPLKNPFLTISPCWEVAPGQAFTLLWGSDIPDARACIEWYKDGMLLKREWSAVDRTQQVFSYTPDESMRGGFTVCVTQTTMNRLMNFFKTIEVPWTNKMLKVRWEHLTSKLEPGARDTWTAVVTGPDGQTAAAEMVATLYDASLDSVREHFFPTFNFRGESSIAYPYYPSQGMSYLSFSKCSYWNFPDSDSRPWEMRHPYRIFNMLRNDYNRWSGDSDMVILGHLSSNYDYAPPEPQGSFPCTPASPVSGGFFSDSPVPAVSRVTARRNLRETAFFYPHLTSNEKGEVRMTFTMPEALTQWKFLGFAHDKALRSGLLEGTTVTAKDLMVQPNPPRFLREGDALDFTVKITNQSEREQSGAAGLTLADALTQKDTTAALGITESSQKWTIPAKESRTLSWHITVPDGTDFLTYKALATSGALSDGEEGWLPVIPRRMMLTESLTLPIRDAGTKDYR
ncbi:MAG: alpha-2-macroglobulin family protein, partial [Verrucomicrobiota bacterium]